MPLSLFGSTIPQGDFISSTYRLRNAQLTWNYLTWPAPPEDSKWRFHTLYSFNYTGVSATVDAPFEPSATFVPAHGYQEYLLSHIRGGAGVHSLQELLFRGARPGVLGFPIMPISRMRKRTRWCVSSILRSSEDTSASTTRPRPKPTNTLWGR